MAKQRPQDKGTKAETDVVLWAKKHNFYKADRLTKRGTKDRGDVKLTDRIMVQVKDGYTDKIQTEDKKVQLRDRKEPTDYQVGEWLKATEKQRRLGDYEHALLVHKRFGNADPDNWRWYVDGYTFAALMGVDILEGGGMAPVWPPYIQLQGYMIPPLIRNWEVKNP